MPNDFLPLCKQDMLDCGWQYVDFVVVTGDAYVDHPSFGAAIIARVLQSEGYRVGILAQPNFTSPFAKQNGFTQYGMPRYGFFIGGGNVDSMVAHYTVAKVRRKIDEYSPGGKLGLRPDRCVTIYSQLAKAAYPNSPIIIGGLEASLRRFAHYDYWKDEVLPSVLQDSGADLLSFGMGEHQTKEIAKRLYNNEQIENIKDVNGTCYLCTFDELPKEHVRCGSFHKVKTDKGAYAKACLLQADNQDVINALPVVQKQNELFLVQNIPATPLTQNQLDHIYSLPFTRKYHPSYEKQGGVPAIEEVEFSIIQNRGCFGSCNFCAIQMHQGRRVTSRSANSIINEAEIITNSPNFKGYIHDVGGPTANFRNISCAKQMKEGMCKSGKFCLAPKPCKELIVNHSEYLQILKSIRQLPNVKKVFIRSGIRYDYLLCDKDETFLKELVKHHVSGQLKVAPEHCAPQTLSAMGKPSIDVFDKFAKKFYAHSKTLGKKQYLVPYLMSSHPGSTLKDAVLLAEYLYKNNMRPEQVQDFYPTPGTISTCMFYTGLNPYTMKSIYVAKNAEEKALQRALLQYYNAKNKEKVIKALKLTNRQDLIPLLVYKTKQAKTIVKSTATREQKRAANTAKKHKHTAKKGANTWPNPKNAKQNIRKKSKNI